MPSIVTPIPPGDLARMVTKQLLGLRDRLLACEESFERSDATPEEIDPTTIRFKADPRWTMLYDAVKVELATREHVPGGDQRRTDRQERARRSTERAPRAKPRR